MTLTHTIRPNNGKWEVGYWLTTTKDSFPRWEIVAVENKFLMAISIVQQLNNTQGPK